MQACFRFTSEYCASEYCTKAVCWVRIYLWMTLKLFKSNTTITTKTFIKIKYQEITSIIRAICPFYYNLYILGYSI